MLTRKRQRKYISKIKKEAVEQLKKIAGPVSAEDLHHLRIAIKKMKSFQTFLSPSTGKKYIRPLKKIFAESGNVRDIHIANLIEADHFKLSPAIKNKRQREFIDAYQKFALHTAAYPKCFAKTSKRLQSKIRNVPVHSIKNHFSLALDAIPKNLSTDNDKKIHSCRKRLKNLLYLYHMLSESLQEKLQFPIDDIDKLQDMIGKWHDLVIAEPILKKRMSSTQILVITREKENLLKEARKMSEQYL
jgi:CHAD domain-containing protein